MPTNTSLLYFKLFHKKNRNFYKQIFSQKLHEFNFYFYLKPYKKKTPEAINVSSHSNGFVVFIKIIKFIIIIQK